MDNIIDLIPQRPPMVMVDELLGVEENQASTRLVVSKENIFVDEDVLTEGGLIEHMAQSAAARAGYLFRSKGQPVPVGYIASVNDFVMSEHPKVGEVITTEVEVLQEVANISLIQARSAVRGKEVAFCKMKIVLEP